MALDSTSSITRSRSHTIVTMESKKQKVKHSSITIPQLFDLATPEHPRELKVTTHISGGSLGLSKSSSSFDIRGLNEGVVKSTTLQAFKIQQASFRYSQGITPRSFEQVKGVDLQERLNNIAVLVHILLSKLTINNTIDLSDNDLIIVCNTEERIYKFSKILSVILNDLQSAIDTEIWQATSFGKDFTLGYIIDHLIQGFKEKIPESEFANKESTIKTLENLSYKLDFEIKRKNSQACKAFAADVMKSYVEANPKHVTTHFFLNTLLSMYHDDKKDVALQDVIASDNFLLTYKMVGNSTKLFKSILKALSLLDAYNANKEHKVLARVKSQKKIIIAFIFHWLKDRHYVKDLKKIEIYLNAICDLIKEKFPIESEMLLDLYKEEGWALESFHAIDQSQTGVYPIKIDPSFTMVNSVANDLNYMVLKNIQALELSDMLVDSENSSWRAIIDFNNHLANFVTYTILRGSFEIDIGEVSAKRSKTASKAMIHFFVKLAEKCIADKNFEAAQSIHNGLSHLLLERHIKKIKLNNENLNHLKETFSLDFNQRNLRNLLNTVNKDTFHILPSQIFCKDYANLINNQLKVEGKYNTCCLIRMGDALREQLRIKKVASELHLCTLTSFQSLLREFVKSKFDLDVKGKDFLNDFKYR